MLRTLIIINFILLTIPALAQNPSTSRPANPTVPIPPLKAPSPPPERIAPANSPPSRGNLSDQLYKQKGTITPPNVDPHMNVVPLSGGIATTPVIPPPGAPGGNSSVVPK